MSFALKSPGHRVWIFPDGEIPPHDPSDPALTQPGVHGHESLVVLNTTEHPVRPVLHVYFSDHDPWRIELATIPARRVICYRTDEPLGVPGGEQREIPHNIQYALVLECDGPVVAQLGRMDIRQPNLAYYTVMSHPAA